MYQIVLGTRERVYGLYTTWELLLQTILRPRLVTREGLYTWYDDYYDDDDDDDDDDDEGKFLSGTMVIKNERFKKSQ